MDRAENKPYQDSDKQPARDEQPMASQSIRGYSDQTKCVEISLREQLERELQTLSCRVDDLNWLLNNLTPEMENSFIVQQKLRAIGYR